MLWKIKLILLQNVVLSNLVNVKEIIFGKDQQLVSVLNMFETKHVKDFIISI